MATVLVALAGLIVGQWQLVGTRPPEYTLTWLEVMFGQFYMAVVVAQLVGLTLAQALRGGGPEGK